MTNDYDKTDFQLRIQRLEEEKNIIENKYLTKIDNL